MPCYHPLKAIRSASGVKVLSADATIWNLTLPCGRCSGCRLQKSREWALRCIHEAKSYEHNCFITLTYNDDHMPQGGSLHYPDYQLFMKRLRKEYPIETYGAIRYYMAGEYGGKLGRPHFHACLFNHTFDDLEFLRKSPTGHPLFTSAKLERLWPFGYSSIGALTFESAAYVARYIMKKATGKNATRTYDTVNTDTGEIFSRAPEFNHMSLKPGIGANWFKAYSQEVTVRDAVIHDGSPHKVPRYYDKLLSRTNPELHSSIKDKRLLDAIAKCSDNTPTRLEAKEIVSNAAISQLKRKLL